MWYLAIQQLLARKKQTALVIGGILLGTAAYIAFSGIMLGFQEYIIERLVNGTGHIRVSAREEEIDPKKVQAELYDEGTLVSWKKAPSGRRDYARINYPAGWFELLESDSRVAAYSPQLSVQALAKRGSLSASVSVVGVDSTRMERVTNINDFIKGGTLSDIGRSGNRLIAGKGVLARLGAAPGETLELSTVHGSPLSFRILRAFELGVPQLDDTTIYASLSDVQKLNATPSQISDIIIRLNRLSDAEPMAENLAIYSQDKVESWADANQGILSVFNMQTIIRNVMSFCILLVAGFGIYNVLNMVVNQKRKEIGILRSMGYTGGEVSKLFLIQGFIFGTLGGAFGVVFGYFVCQFVSTVHIGVPGTVGYRSMLVSYDWQIYLKAFVLASSASILAGWIPAHGAGKLSPIDIVRTEGG